MDFRFRFRARSRVVLISFSRKYICLLNIRTASQLGTLRSADCQLGRVVRDAVRILSKQIYFLEKLIKTTRDRARNLNRKSTFYCSHTDHEGIHYHVKMTKFATRNKVHFVFYTKKIDLVIYTVKNTAHWISSDGDLMTKLLNRSIFLNSNVRNNTLTDKIFWCLYFSKP